MKKIFFLIFVLFMLSACTARNNLTSTLVPAAILVETNTPVPEPTRTELPPTPTITFEVSTQTPTPSPEPTRTPSLEKIREQPYAGASSTKQFLDIYLPTSSGGPIPSLLVIHGGGGDKADFSSIAIRFVKLGYAVVSINYRDIPKDIYPAAVQDAFCALAWMHANSAGYNLDPARIFALGHSSGGTMAAMLGTVDDAALFLESCPFSLPESSWIRGVVTFTGIFDYASATADLTELRAYIYRYLGEEQDIAPIIWAEASPLSWVDGSEPPFLVIHGEADQNIRPKQSVIFAEALETAQMDVQLMLIPDLDHGGIIWNETALESVILFLDALANP